MSQLSALARDVFNALGALEWKTAAELAGELTRRKRRRVSRLLFFVALFDIQNDEERPAVRDVLVSLEELRGRGLVEGRFRGSPQAARRFGHRPRREWRLTEEGRRIRATYSPEHTRRAGPKDYGVRTAPYRTAV